MVINGCIVKENGKPIYVAEIVHFEDVSQFNKAVAECKKNVEEKQIEDLKEVVSLKKRVYELEQLTKQLISQLQQLTNDVYGEGEETNEEE